MIRRRSRGLRSTAAVALLVVAGLLLPPALAVGERVLISVTAIVGYLAAVGAARMLSNEHARTRREAARDRAAQAQDYQQIYAARLREQGQFAASMTARVDSLREELRTTCQHADDAQRKAREESERTGVLQARVAELETQITALTGDLSQHQALAATESLEFWYGRHDPGVEQLLEWEERTA